MGGQRSAIPRPRIPIAYRQLPGSQRRLLTGGLVLVAVALIIDPRMLGLDEVAWARAQLTSASLFSFVAAAASVPGTSGRIRAVRTWITIAIGLWLLAELFRNAEVALGYTDALRPSDVLLLAVLLCAVVAYASAARHQLPLRDELALYLDATTVFFATAALVITALGPRAPAYDRGPLDLAYAIFFLSTFGATLLLDVSVRAERRLHGAYVVLAGLLLLGLAFLWRLIATAPTGTPDAGIVSDLLTLGIAVVMLGTVTWTDRQDLDPSYLRLAAGLRSGLPLVAVTLTPVLLMIAATRDLPGLMGLVDLLAIGLVLVTVAARQTVLLREREDAVQRERELSAELTTAEARYRTLVERQPGIVYLAEPGQHGRWQYVSPQIESILGFSREEWMADPTLWARRLHPADRERILAAEALLPAATSAHGSQVWEYRLLAADGREVWVMDDEAVVDVDAEGRPTLVQGLLLDITERKRAEEALRVSEEQTRLIIDTASYAFIGMDKDGLVIDWNQRATDTFGWTRDEAMGRRLADLVIPPEFRAAHTRGLAHYLATGEGPILGKRTEVTALHRDGRQFPLELTVWPVQSGGGIRFNALVDDITVRKQLEDQLRHQALHDALSGLPNRVLFTDRLQHALALAEGHPDQPLGVLFLDLDDFKTINDSLGHSVGDELLRAVADRLRASLRPEDTAARLGGDEFAILVESSQPGEISEIASRLLAELARPFEIDGDVVSVRASIGVSLSSPSQNTADALLRNADLAMYLAKARGKNRQELYTPGLHQQALRRLDLRRALEQAIAEDRLAVHYQPVVALDDGSIVGLEALLRWPGADGKFIPLTEIIPLAEETGLIIPIGRFVLERACRDARRFRDELGTGERLDMAVNVSAVELERGTLAQDVTAATRAAGIPATSLVLELTESSLTNDSLDTIRTLRSLQADGVRLALDDFGTGYSSLARLQRFAVDIVKIDRDFVGALHTERGDLLVQSIIDLGRTLGMEIVAEGIESVQQRDLLRTRGAQLGQGYFFAKPLPADAISPLLAVGRLPLPSRRGRAALGLSKLAQ